jgi:hypothetical protein
MAWTVWRNAGRGDNRPVRRPPLGTPEKTIQTQCRHYLRLKGYGVWDTSQPFRAAITPGLPDLIVFTAATVVFVEVKSAAGRLTPAQRTFQAACQAVGLPYLVVRSVGDLIDGLNALGE